MKKTIKAGLLVAAILGFANIGYAENYLLDVSVINKTILTYQPQTPIINFPSTIAVHPGEVELLQGEKVLTEPRKFFISYMDEAGKNGFQITLFGVKGKISNQMCSTSFSPDIKCTITSTVTEPDQQVIKAVIEYRH